MRALASAVFCAAMLLAAPALAGPPFVTDDPEPVELHHWEVYGFSAATQVQGDMSGTLAGIEINNGAAPELQLHAIVPLAFDAPKNGPMQTGLGDIELGAKYRFFNPAAGDWRPEIGMFPLLELPTGEAAKGLGSGHLRAFIPVWLQKNFGRWTSYGGAGYWINPGRGNRNSWFIGWLLQRQVTDSLALGAELFHQTADHWGGKDTTGFNAGGQYDFSEHYHLLFSAGRGLQHPGLNNQFSYYLALQWTGP